MERNNHAAIQAIPVILVSLIFLAAAVLPAAALVQTDIIYSIQDTYVNNSAADTNFDGNTLKTGKPSADTLESWFLLDLSDPSGYYVVGASLWAYAYAVENNKDYNIHNASGADWTETNLTWNTKPSYGTAVSSAAISAVGWNSWNILLPYARAFDAGNMLISFALETSGAGAFSLDMEDSEDTQGTGNVPYLNLTMMIPEAYPESPEEDYGTYDTSLTFQYNTTDARNVLNCSLLLDGSVNKTNSSVPENASSYFIVSGLAVGEHNWSVTCYDSNRETYQFSSTTRTVTVLASVEWHNPSSATPLDIGSASLGGAQPSGSREVYANNSNTNVDISCAAGDCSVVTTDWTPTGISGGGTEAVTFNCTTGTAGSYQADFEVTSDQDSSADTLTVNCTITAPDLRVNSTNITFSDNAPSENQAVTITAGIYNDGTEDASDAVVRFYEGHYSLGSQIGADQTINLSAGSSVALQQDWTSRIGDFDIYVVVDPPVDSNGSIAEGDESNNHAYSTISISMWTIFVGNITGNLALQTATNQTLLKWYVDDPTQSLVYVVDTDSNPDFASLVAFSRNTSGGYMPDDFTELDSELNTTQYPDSVNLTFTSGGSPLQTQMFSVFGTDLDDVPVVQSTNSTTFMTGIFWDSSDDNNSNNQFDNTSDEDVVFVTRANHSHTGMYGTYDYEIRVPARLKDYKGPDTQTVTFYTEIK